MKQHLDQTRVLPAEYNPALNRLHHHTRTSTKHLLDTQYWTTDHLRAYREFVQNDDTSSHNWKYFYNDNACDHLDTHLYNRYKRMVAGRLAQIFDAHADEQHALDLITDTVKERKIRAIGYRRLREKIFNELDEYVSWSVVSNVVDKLNNYYDTHGEFPDEYLDLVGMPDPNGTTLAGPDSRGDIIDLDYDLDSNTLDLSINAPDSTDPDAVNSASDWTRHEFTLDMHDYFADLAAVGELKRPSLRRESDNHGAEQYVLDIPVELDGVDTDPVDGRVLGVDLGVKTQATATVLEDNACECDDGHTEDCTGFSQQTRPFHVDCGALKQKLFRVKSDAEGINSELARLRENGLDHTKRFDDRLAEYRKTRRKERNLREQVQHRVANALVYLAHVYQCETIALESLAELEAAGGRGATSWRIGTWARGLLVDSLEYKAGLVGIDVETVNPWGTSRYCPRCGERGVTVKAPDLRVEQRSGGHFVCEACGFEGDRDYVGSVNVGRMYLSSEWRIIEAKSAAYTDADTTPVRRSTGVRPTAEQATSERVEPVDHWPLFVKPVAPALGTKSESSDDPRSTGESKSSVRLVLFTADHCRK